MIKGFIRSLTPIVIIPLFLGFLILKIFGLTLSSCLLIVMIAQIYIVWFQAEIMLRQTKLTELSYEPVLLIKTEQKVRTNGRRAHTSVYVKIKNISDNPAYNLIVYPDLATRKVLPNLELRSIIGVLERGREETLCVLSERDVRSLRDRGLRMIINVDYENVLGRHGGMAFILDPTYLDSPISAHGVYKLPGVLLNSIEELCLLIGLFTLPRRIKRLVSLSRL